MSHVVPVIQEFWSHSWQAGLNMLAYGWLVWEPWGLGFRMINLGNYGVYGLGWLVWETREFGA